MALLGCRIIASSDSQCLKVSGDEHLRHPLLFLIVCVQTCIELAFLAGTKIARCSCLFFAVAHAPIICFSCNINVEIELGFRSNFLQRAPCRLLQTICLLVIAGRCQESGENDFTFLVAQSLLMGIIQGTYLECIIKTEIFSCSFSSYREELCRKIVF